jgi:hypothetical protein
MSIKEAMKRNEEGFSFLTGVCSAFGFNESRLENVADRMFEVTDEDYLKRDFYSIGQDIRNAMDSVVKSDNLVDCNA